MEFCLLGPLTVRCHGVLVAVAPGKQRAVLAALLLRAGQVVSLDDLTETVWGTDPPPTARVGLQNYVMRLRKALSINGRSPIGTQPGGYLISAEPAELDVARFEVLLRAARAGAQDRSWETAARQADAALRLWRGDPLSGVGSESLERREVPRLLEMRVQAFETRVDADLHLGRHGEVISELRQLTDTHPLRERLHTQLVLALYRDSRQAEALAAYQSARRAIVSELGVEPGEALQRMHQRILSGDPGLAVASAQRRGPVGAHERVVVPHQLPAVVPHFTGRETELAELASLRPPDPGGSEAVVISAVAGMAGVGKTALAVRWCQQVAAEFPDGQLYVNLRGFGPEGEPADPATAIRGFLDALGVRAERIPASPEAQAGLYRSLLAGLRILLLLDNAQNEAQVRPLLPASPSCLAVVTSRTRLVGLAATEGARLMSLDVLSADEARQMLRRCLGLRRVQAEPDAAAELITLCGRLPLALAIIAARAADRPDFLLANLAQELREGQRLGALDTGDTATSAEAVFSWSYQQLSAPAARMFRLMSLAPGPDLPGHAAAQLAEVSPSKARDLLRGLVRGCLLTEPSPGRYAFHDLLRAYAAQQAEAADPDSERAAALTRLFDHYLTLAGAAMDILEPADRQQRPKLRPPGTDAPPVSTPAIARAWLDAERANLVSIAGHTASSGRPDYATALAAILFRYLDGGGHYTEGLAVHTHALHAAQQMGDRLGEADALRHRCGIDYRQGRYGEVVGQLAEALSIYCDMGYRTGQAQTLNNLGIVLRAQGLYREALRYHQQALVLFREEGEEFGEALTMDALGNTLRRLGRHQESADYHRRALAQFHAMAEVRSAAYAVGNLGVAFRHLGRLEEATRCHEQSLALNRQVNCRYGEAEALNDMGSLLRHQGLLELAADHHREALELFRTIGNPVGQVAALNGLGEVTTDMGQPAGALSHYTAALDLVTQVTDRYEKARTLDGLARAYHLTGDTQLAHDHKERALALHMEMGLPDTSRAPHDPGPLAPDVPNGPATQ